MCHEKGPAMVSISTKRDDWNAIEATRDVKYLADRVFKEEAKAARMREPVPKKGITPQVLAKLLPPDMRVSSNKYTSDQV